MKEMAIKNISANHLCMKITLVVCGFSQSTFGRNGFKSDCRHISIFWSVKMRRLTSYSLMCSLERKKWWYCMKAADPIVCRYFT